MEDTFCVIPSKDCRLVRKAFENAAKNEHLVLGPKDMEEIVGTRKMQDYSYRKLVRECQAKAARQIVGAKTCTGIEKQHKRWRDAGDFILEEARRIKLAELIEGADKEPYPLSVRNGAKRMHCTEQYLRNHGFGQVIFRADLDWTWRRLSAHLANSLARS